MLKSVGSRQFKGKRTLANNMHNILHVMRDLKSTVLKDRL